ncbi:MAG: hypothetical protein P8L31_00845 [Pseudomonadales bacterium]|nr:hypothetical protein [Pseudomonadales bacterium]
MNQETKIETEPTDGNGDTEDLRTEVAKWQERVPKLASALRERTDELARVRDEIGLLKQQSRSRNDLALRARDDLIAELESKSNELRSKRISLAGEARSMEIALGEAQGETAHWKSKWRGVTGSLDELSAERSEQESTHHSERQSFKRERSSWDEERARLVFDLKERQRLTQTLHESRKRNEQLVETTGMAKLQIDALGEELASLVSRAENAEASSRGFAEKYAQAESALEKALSKFAQTLENEQETKLAEMGSLHAQALQKKEEQLSFVKTQITEFKRKLAEVEGRAHQACDDHEATRAGLERSLQKTKDECVSVSAEVARLDGCLAVAIKGQKHAQHERAIQTQSIAALEEEVARMELSREKKALQGEALQAELTKLQSMLHERTQLVQNLEEERNERLRSGPHLQGTVVRLEQDLNAERQISETLKAHAVTVEARVNDQRQHMEKIGRELSEEQTKRVEQQRLYELEKRLRENLENRISRGDAKWLVEEKAELAEEHQRKLDAEIATLREQVSVLNATHEIERVELRERLKKESTENARAAAKEIELSQRRVAELEAEVISAEAEFIAHKVESVDALEVQVLTAQMCELKNKLRQRNIELDELRWQTKQKKQQTNGSTDAKMVLVLGQQLQDARAEIGRLRDQARSSTANDKGFKDDNIIQLKGVGTKLAEQLCALGIQGVSHIAAIDASDLDDQDHPLHGYRSRLLRGDWIAQARGIIAKQTL